MRTTILVFHICGGLVGLLSGAAAASFRKGSRLHALAGNLFVVSMLSMAAAGVLLAIMKSQPGNILGGTLTLYLVATAWLTAKRRDKDAEIGLFDLGALSVVLAITAVEMTWGIQAAISPSGLKYDYPPGPFFFMGSVAALAAVGDFRMLVHRGISGGRRIARHLWRMCFALFIASASIFLARQQIFPALLRKSGVLILLSFLPLLVMIFWLIRGRFANVYRRMTSPTHA